MQNQAIQVGQTTGSAIGSHNRVISISGNGNNNLFVGADLQNANFSDAQYNYTFHGNVSDYQDQNRRGPK